MAGSYFLLLVTLITFIACNQKSVEKRETKNVDYTDVPFIQETHEAFYVSDNDADNEIRSIAVDSNSNVWIATATGIFQKAADTHNWIPVITDENRGPAYSVAVTTNGDVLLGTWNGLYRFSSGKLMKEEGVKPPVSVICNNGNIYYALGPYGIWHYENLKWEEQPYHIARSVRDAIVGNNGDLWVATDAGLYRCNKGKTELFQNTDELISCYVKAVSLGPDNKLWTGVMGGVSIRENNRLIKNLTPEDGIPSIFVHCIEQSPEGVMWVGTDVGVVRFSPDGSHSLRFSKRWLTNDKVNDIAFDKNGNAWLATANGVSLIQNITMTLAEKERIFYHK